MIIHIDIMFPLSLTQPDPEGVTKPAKDSPSLENQRENIRITRAANEQSPNRRVVVTEDNSQGGAARRGKGRGRGLRVRLDFEFEGVKERLDTKPVCQYVRTLGISPFTYWDVWQRLRTKAEKALFDT